MKLFKRFFRDEQQQEVEGVELWYVRWRAHQRDGYDPEKFVEAFTSKEAADDFADALNDAKRLLRYYPMSYGLTRKDLSEPIASRDSEGD